MNEIQAKAGTSQELGFVKSEKTGELAQSAAAEQTRAEIECAFVMAYRRPRDLDTARQQMLQNCRRLGFAETACYEKPVAGRTIKGPSIRFAEMAVQAYKNCRVATKVIYEDDDKRVLHVSVTDLESNLSYGKDISIAKTVERLTLKPGMTVISERTNSNGQKTYLIRATEDDLANKVAAAESKIIRNCGLRLIPGDLIEECIAQVDATIQAGESSDPQAAKKKVLDAFAALGVQPSDLQSFVGHSLGTLSPDEVKKLRRIYTTIKDGEATWAEYVAQKQPAKTKEEAAIGDLKPAEKVEVNEELQEKVAYILEGAKKLKKAEREELTDKVLVVGKLDVEILMKQTPEKLEAAAAFIGEKLI